MNKETQIRKAVQVDSEKIAMLLTKAFSEFKRFDTKKAYKATVLDKDGISERLKKGECWVCVDNTNIIGTLSTKITPKGLCLCGMAVHPHYRGL